MKIEPSDLKMEQLVVHELERDETTGQFRLDGAVYIELPDGRTISGSVDAVMEVQP